MEYCSGGDFFSYIEKRGFSLKEEKVREIINKICSAVFYLHSYGIMHRNLNPESIIMTDDTDKANLKIFDFGYSKILNPVILTHNLLFSLMSHQKYC